MRNFITAALSKAATKHTISDQKFVAAAERIRAGNASADLGGGLFKERIAREGQGRSGGFRTVLCFREGGDMLFFAIFAKKRKGNLTKKELEAARKFAAEFRKQTEKEIQRQIADSTIRELNVGGDDAVTQPDDKKETNETDMQDDQGELNS